MGGSRVSRQAGILGLMDLQAVRLFSLASCVVALAGLGTVQAATQAPSGVALIKVNADQQTFDTTGRTMFKGNVFVSYRNIEIKSPTASIDVVKGSHVASFYNRPVAKRNEPGKGIDQLEADIIRVYLDNNAVRAEGNTVFNVTTVASNPINIRADVQEFDNASKAMTARGNVRVVHDGTTANSSQANVKMGENGKAERVVFSGGVSINKDQTTVNGNRVTLMMASGNMIAENNVRTAVNTKSETGKPVTLKMNSDFQQYDKQSGSVLASGNVHIYYDNYHASGPKASIKMNGGSVDRILLTGRPSISDGTRNITADNITITTNPKHFDAVGHVKTQFKTTTGQGGVPATSSVSPGGKKPAAKSSAGKGKTTNSSIPEAPQFPVADDVNEY